MTSKPVIAVVDDDESVRTAVGGMLETLGYSAGVFESAEAFLNSGGVAGTACLILDVQMPGTSGIDLFSQLVSAGHRIPTIFITAHPDTRARDRMLLAGAVCYLPKPFARDELSGCIATALNSPSPG